MVRLSKKTTRKRPENQGRKQPLAKAIKIGPSTPYGYTDEYLTPFGGLLALEKLLDGLKFKELFEQLFVEPNRKTFYGSYFFIKGFLLLLFIGFRRLYHFVYIQEDPMLLGIDDRQRAVGKKFLFNGTSIGKFFMCVNNNFLQGIGTTLTY